MKHQRMWSSQINGAQCLLWVPLFCAGVQGGIELKEELVTLMFLEKLTSLLNYSSTGCHITMETRQNVTWFPKWYWDMLMSLLALSWEFKDLRPMDIGCEYRAEAEIPSPWPRWFPQKKPHSDFVKLEGMSRPLVFNKHQNWKETCKAANCSLHLPAPWLKSSKVKW